MRKPTCPPARLDARLGLPPVPPPQGFLFVDQANYAVVPADRPEPIYLYSDSATSCVIVIGVGSDGRGERTASLAHLDSPDCIEAYFAAVLDRTYVGEVYVYAQGANPPDDGASRDNAGALSRCLADRSTGRSPWSPYVVHLGLGEGDPRFRDRGDYGISIRPEGSVVSTQPFALELRDRDPTGGQQTLFCIMRRHLSPPIPLHDALTPFDDGLVARLAQVAATYRKDPSDPATAFTEIINLTDEKVRGTWSTTPRYEAAWFSDELKQSCCYTKVYLASRGGARER